MALDQIEGIIDTLADNDYKVIPHNARYAKI